VSDGLTAYEEFDRDYTILKLYVGIVTGPHSVVQLTEGSRLIVYLKLEKERKKKKSQDGLDHPDDIHKVRRSRHRRCRCHSPGSVL
jgi:hypothetical protein